MNELVSSLSNVSLGFIRAFNPLISFEWSNVNMKSYSNLYEIFISDENIKQSIINAIKNKSKRKDVKWITNHPDEFVEEIRDYAINFRPYKNHIPTIITDGCKNKKREIIVPEIHEHVVHHMIVNTMTPMLTKGMYAHTYSSIPGRGLHKCRNKVEKWLKDTKHTKYCLKLDIKKFFNSIDHDILLERLRWYIKDNKFYHILEKLIAGGDYTGLPLGFYTSHWLANWLLQPLDHYIKEALHIKYYVRYMDDIVLFANKKKILHKAFAEIKEYLSDLKLMIKQDWQIFRLDYIKKGKHKGRALDFCGFKFYRDRVQLRKTLLHRFLKKSMKIAKKKKCTIHDAHQLMSYMGYIQWADIYEFYMKYIAPNMPNNKCRKRISQYDNRQKKLNKMIQQTYAVA